MYRYDEFDHAFVKARVAEFSNHILPMGTESAMRFEEPIQWRGGVMHEL